MKCKIIDEDFKTAQASRWPPNVGKRCVEVKRTHSDILLRDSKNPAGATLSFTDAEWEAFIIGAKHGEFEVFE